MGWPQIVMILFLGLSLGCSLADHGKPKTGKNSFWHSLFSAAILSGLLIAGGFFD